MSPALTKYAMKETETGNADRMILIDLDDFLLWGGMVPLMFADSMTP